MPKHDLFEVILCCSVLAVRPVTVTNGALHELFVDLGFRAAHMLREIDEPRKASEFRNGAT